MEGNKTNSEYVVQKVSAVSAYNSRGKFKAIKFGFAVSKTMKYIRMVFNKTSADEILKKRLFQN